MTLIPLIKLKPGESRGYARGKDYAKHRPRRREPWLPGNPDGDGWKRRITDLDTPTARARFIPRSARKRKAS